ncbi:MAG: hypothetical protein QXL86_02400 [Candidatus Aenigmatarchaeota archaeon]
MEELQKLKREIEKTAKELKRSMREEIFLLYIDDKTLYFFTQGTKILIFNTNFYEIFPNEVSIRGDSEEVSIKSFIEDYVKDERFARKILKKMKEKLDEYKP